MLYKFFNSKKGFTLVELLVVVVILSVLVAVAVPVFDTGLKRQKKEDCRNQRLVIETTVKQAMFGMIDNGKKQPQIYFENCTSDTQYPGDGVENTADDDYVGKACFVFTYPAKAEGETTQKTPYISGAKVFTLGDLRGGYRGNPNLDYRKYCEAPYNNYLKKQALANDAFYIYLDNQEIPVCPFADFEDDEKDKTNNYYYYVFLDGTVLCSCPECNEVD